MTSQRKKLKLYLTQSDANSTPRVMIEISCRKKPTTNTCNERVLVLTISTPGDLPQTEEYYTKRFCVNSEEMIF